MPRCGQDEDESPPWLTQGMCQTGVKAGTVGNVWVLDGNMPLFLETSLCVRPLLTWC